MPAKLGDPNEPTVAIRIRLPLSMKKWLEGRRGGTSAYVRRLVEAKMAKKASPDLTD